MQWSCVGHESQKEYLERLITMSRFGHASLFAGPEGVGKRMMALDVARALGVGDGSPDRMFIAPEVSTETGKLKDIAVETIREQVRPWAFTRPVYGTRKVAIIDDAERLGGEAANTLLKVLEEPPAYLIFLLITSQPQEILGTISSRCQLLRFAPLTDAEMQSILGTRYSPLVQALAAGRPGAALRLLEGDRLKEAERSLADLASALEGSVAHRIGLAKTIADAEDPAAIAGWWLAYVNARLKEKPSLAPVARGLLHLNTVLSESRYNRRLALEEFLLTAPGLN